MSGNPPTTWLQRMRDTWMCGVRPRRLEARDAEGRYLAGTPWNGDRGTAEDLLRRVAAESSEARFALEVTYYHWDDHGRRHAQLRTVDFTEAMHELSAEQRDREQARAARLARRVKWLAPKRPLARRTAA